MKTIFGFVVVLLVIFMLTTQTGIAFDTKEPAVSDLRQLETAAMQGDAKAMYELGKRYENGVGVIQNYVQAHAMYNISASRGYTDAPKARDALAKKMTAEQLAEAQKIAINWRPSAAADKKSPKGAAKESGVKGASDSIWDAAKTGDTARVKELLKQGTSPNEKDPNGWFPLMYAAFGGHKETVDALLAAGADMNMKKPDGSTALMAAALKGHKSVVEVLLGKGADVKAVSSKGLTAAIIAKQKGYPEISALFVGKLRSLPETNLSYDSVMAMLKDKGLFDSDYNKGASGFSNKFELQQNGQVVFDHASGLMWQQSGSSEYMKYDKAKEYVAQLNREGFAGYRDWRLPTLEEAMSLMEPTKMNGDLYIDSVFDKNQRWIWTSDTYSASSAWVVYFYYGLCSYDYFNGNDYVRAVR